MSELIDLSTPLGIIMAVIGLYLAFKLVAWILKVAMVGLVVFGLYLAFVA